MIIKEIQLEDCGVFREPHSFILSEGLNLLVGPNESGKSTLTEAMRLAFIEKHTVRTGKVQQLVPWGSSLCPKISVIFETGGATYRITKQFLIESKSILEKQMSGSWSRICDGDTADRTVAEMVGGRVASGTSRPEHWGLTQLLWTRQGEMCPKVLNEDSKRRIESICGVAVTTKEESKIINRITDEFESSFQPARRNYKTGCEMDRLLDKIQEKEDGKADLERKLLEHEKLIRDINDTRISLSEKQNLLDEARQAFENAKKEVGKAIQHEQDRKAIANDLKILEERYDSRLQKINKVKEHEKSLKEGEQEIRIKEKDIFDENKELDKIKSELSYIKEQLIDIKHSAQGKNDDLIVVRQAWDGLRDKLDLRKYEDSLLRALQYEKDKKSIEAQIELLNAPEYSELRECKNLKDNMDKKRTQLEATGLTVGITVDDNLNGSISLDGLEKELAFTKGTSEEWCAAQKVGLKLSGIAEIFVKSGSIDVQKLQNELVRLEGEISEKTAVYETKDISELENRYNQSLELKRQIENLNGRIIELAPNGVPELERKIKVLRQHIGDIWSKIPKKSIVSMYKEADDVQEAQNIVSAMLEPLEVEIKELQKEEKGLQTKIDEANQTKEAKEQYIKEKELEAQKLKGEMNTTRRDLLDLRNDGLSDNDREQGLLTLGYDIERKRKVIEKLEQEKELEEDIPKNKLQYAETGFENARQMLHNTEKNLEKLDGQLSEQSKHGTYSDLSLVEEELQSLREEEKKLRTSVHAIELLYDLYRCHKEETTKSVIEPLTRMVSIKLPRMIGPSYGSVRLNENYLPNAVNVTDWNLDVSSDLLSFGTQEQMALLTRLALGELLSDSEKQLLILDDPLTNTHVSRLKPALEILREASSKLQVVILTCHANQYSALLGTSNVIEM
jgi:DNA repair exonuclease SbcCD ATPase subunit